MEYDGHYLVLRMAEKLVGEAYYLNAHYICNSAEMAKELLETKSVRETINIGKKTDVALLGIGTTSPDHSSFYLAGYVTRGELDELLKAGSIGDVCGLHFDKNGRPAGDDFSARLVSVSRRDLSAIPVRLAVAGGDWKAQAILGALRIKYVNVLVIDNITARKVIELAKQR
jgi:deoxyribonucleoside regulator